MEQVVHFQTAISESPSSINQPQLLSPPYLLFSILSTNHSRRFPQQKPPDTQNALLNCLLPLRPRRLHPRRPGPVLVWPDRLHTRNGLLSVCASGYKGCCTVDACSVGYCPTNPGSEPTTAPTPLPSTTPPPTRQSAHPERATSKSAPTASRAAVPPTPALWATARPLPRRGAAGTGYYQVCASGFKGCCASDACGLGYCPSSSSSSSPAPKTDIKTSSSIPAGGNDSTCAPGTGYYQVCANGFKGCCTSDACSLGYCPY